jgi:anti-sigma-K factor RskA
LNIDELISSGLLESYVLGTTTARETAMIQKLCKKHPELEKEIEQIEESFVRLSSGIAPRLNPGLKDKISSALAFESNSGAKIIPLESNTEKLRLYKFGIAASLLLFATSLVYNILLQQRVSSMHDELAQLNAAKSYMAQEMGIQQASLNNMNEQLHVIANPYVKTVALKGMNSMEKKKAMIHWNTETNDVYFNASTLPESPKGMQYQLWAMVNGKPVDAGMIDMKDTSSVFQKMKSIKGAQAFAVTIEKMGGNPAPTMEMMVLIGNV